MFLGWMYPEFYENLQNPSECTDMCMCSLHPPIFLPPRKNLVWKPWRLSGTKMLFLAVEALCILGVNVKSLLRWWERSTQTVLRSYVLLTVVNVATKNGGVVTDFPSTLYFMFGYVRWWCQHKIYCWEFDVVVHKFDWKQCVWSLRMVG